MLGVLRSSSMVRDLRYQASASSSRPGAEKNAELVVTAGDAWPVAEFLVDGQGLEVPGLGVI